MKKVTDMWFAPVTDTGRRLLGIAMLVFLVGCASLPVAQDPLSQWNEGAAKHSIVDYVTAVTDKTSDDFIPIEERIAVFDNDGTLWAEQPVYVQVAFMVDRINALSPQHPEWRQTEPFRSVLEGDVPGALAGGDAALIAMLLATHSGMTEEEFSETARSWIATATHPVTGKKYTDMVYAPMLEVLLYLRDNGFKTYIVSGGGIEFMRPWTQSVYGIPPEQVIGSTVAMHYEIRAGMPILVRDPEVDFINDGPGKPVGISRYIGRRPVVAFGNSDGDLQMLQWVDASPHRSLSVLVHHTDAQREWAYDAPSHIGQLRNALLEAGDRGWTVADMKRDWKSVFVHSENSAR